MKSIHLKARPAACMTMSIALHFAGYELARSALLALFTSHRSGFESASSVSLAVGCVSPFSILLLWGFTRTFDRSGPRVALRYATWVVALQLAFASTVLYTIDAHVETSFVYRWLSRCVLFALFVSQSAFVQLLYTQHWCFLGSIFSEEEGAVWFAPIAGIGSVASTLATWLLLPTVDQIGLTGILMLASLMMVGCVFFSEWAYDMADKHGLAPMGKGGSKNSKNGGSSGAEKSSSRSLVYRARELFQRVPILGVMCVEALLCQCQSSLLNYLFVSNTQATIVADEDRARFTGVFYTWINMLSGILQFVLLPIAFKWLDRKLLWLVIPSIMLVSAVLIATSNTTSDTSAAEVGFNGISISFGLYKTLEYSLRGALIEMVYVSLEDDETRFLGKEIVGLFANRVGKSVTAIGLALLTRHYHTTFAQVAPAMLLGLSCMWFFSSVRLVRFLYTMSTKTIQERSPTHEKQS